MKNFLTVIVFALAALITFTHCRKQEKLLSDQIQLRPVDNNEIPLLSDYNIPLPESSEPATPSAPSAPSAPAPAAPAAPEEPAPLPPAPRQPEPEEAQSRKKNDSVRRQKLQELTQVIARNRKNLAILNRQRDTDLRNRSVTTDKINRIDAMMRDIVANLKKINAEMSDKYYLCYTNCLCLGTIKFGRLMVNRSVTVPNGIYTIRYHISLTQRKYRGKVDSAKSMFYKEHDNNYYRHPKRYEVSYECTIHETRWIREQAERFYQKHPDRYALRHKRDNLQDKLKKCRDSRAYQQQLLQEQTDSLKKLEKQIRQVQTEIKNQEQELSALRRS